MHFSPPTPLLHLRELSPLTLGNCNAGTYHFFPNVTGKYAISRPSPSPWGEKMAHTLRDSLTSPVHPRKSHSPAHVGDEKWLLRCMNP